MAANILETIDMRKLGQELQAARRKSGRTQEEAADLLGVARTTITAIEKGERRIKPNELIELARFYGRQVSDFVRTRPQVEPLTPIFRGPYLAKEGDEEKIRQYVSVLEDLCRDYLELENINAAPLLRKYPPEEDISRSDPELAGESIANSQRNYLHLGEGPISSLRDVLEREAGLRIFYIPMFPREYSEMYVYEENLGACIAVNNQHPAERQYWSLAHGYAHFLADRFKPILFVDKGYQRLPASERFADAFARYFLMPTASLKRQFSNIQQAKSDFTIADLLTLANYFGVSVAALTLRLEDLKLLALGTWDQIRISGLKIRNAQQELGLYAPHKAEPDLPIRYQYLALNAFDNGAITEGQFSHFMRLDRIDARRIAEHLRVQPEGISDDSNIELRLNNSIHG